MTKLADEAARLRALTELHLTLLVEAAAGTGKTALMAGRLTMLLMSGAEPRSIATITFTELASSERARRARPPLCRRSARGPYSETAAGGSARRADRSAAACAFQGRRQAR